MTVGNDDNLLNQGEISKFIYPVFIQLSVFEYIRVNAQFIYG